MPPEDWTFPQQRVALADATLDLRGKILRLVAPDLLQRHRHTVVHVDRPKAGQLPITRPDLVRAFDGRREDCSPASNGQARKAGGEWGYIAVGGPRPFRKYGNHLATLQTSQRLFHTRQSRPLAVDGKRVQRTHQPTQRREIKQRASGKVVHSSPTGHAHQRRVEHALMVGDHQHATLSRNVLPPRTPRPVDDHARKLQPPLCKPVPHPVQQRPLSHS